ncbi:MAG: PadR family transcriptional regulator [Candidatus Aenigmatarchaeota archaeon]
MKGILKILVMKALHDNSNINGAELSRLIEKKTERKPSPGTLYPLLKNLKEENLINERCNGKENIYELTENGNKTLENFTKKREKIIDKIITHLKEYNFLFGEGYTKQFVKNLEKIKECHREMPIYFTMMGKIMNILLNIEEPSKDKEQEIKEILKETRKKIEDVFENERNNN